MLDDNKIYDLKIKFIEERDLSSCLENFDLNLIHISFPFVN